MKIKLILIMTTLPLLAHATLTTNLPGRGLKTVTYSGKSDLCFIPNRIKDGQYSDKDTETETKLCDLNVSVNAAVCGKENSTNPGLQFFELYTGTTAAQMEATDCFMQDKTSAVKTDNAFKKLAKYKNSTSCSYTPSLLSYYHISRYLGNLNQVPVSVLRTVDLKTHIAKGQETLKKLPAGSTIAATWGSLLSFLKAGPAAPANKKDGLFTDDYKQSYGALQKNPGGESNYKELFPGGANQAERAMKFKILIAKTPLVDNRPLATLGLNTWSQVNVQSVLKMQNIADMILMDTLLSQEDRLGNVHYTTEKIGIIKNPTTGLSDVKKLGKPKKGEVLAAGVVLVKRMLMKDNDCGVNRTNHFKNAKLIEDLRHFNPETYHRLLKLQAELTADSIKGFMKKETVMTDTDYANFKTNVNYAVQILQSNCRNKKLQLDLDLDGAFVNAKVNSSCEIN